MEHLDSSKLVKCEVYVLGNSILVMNRYENKNYRSDDYGKTWYEFKRPDMSKLFIENKTLESLNNKTQSINYDNSENRIIQKLREEGIL